MPDPSLTTHADKHDAAVDSPAASDPTGHLDRTEAKPDRASIKQVAAERL